MPRQIRQPESIRLDLTQGDWLLVKKRLNSRESRQVLSDMVKSMPAGERPQLDPMQVQISQIVQYLLDWGTFTDAAGKPLVIRDKSSDEIRGILDNLDADDVSEIAKAIDEHHKAMEAEREEEKKNPFTESKLLAT